MRSRRLLVLTVFIAACSSNGGVSPPGGDDDGNPGNPDGNPGSPDGNPGNPDGGNTPDANPSTDAPGSVTRTVCASGAQYTSISAAITAAGNGDTIEVCAGSYHERIAITKPLFLKGAGAASTTIDGDNAGTVVTVSGLGDDVAIIDGFTITHGFLYI
jgi:hypothetical protein